MFYKMHTYVNSKKIFKRLDMSVQKTFKMHVFGNLEKIKSMFFNTAGRIVYCVEMQNMNSPNTIKF